MWISRPVACHAAQAAHNPNTMAITQSDTTDRDNLIAAVRRASRGAAEKFEPASMGGSPETYSYRVPILALKTFRSLSGADI
jgi:hypothetical protein